MHKCTTLIGLYQILTLKKVNRNVNGCFSPLLLLINKHIAVNGLTGLTNATVDRLQEIISFSQVRNSALEKDFMVIFNG